MSKSICKCCVVWKPSEFLEAAARRCMKPQDVASDQKKLFCAMRSVADGIGYAGSAEAAADLGSIKSCDNDPQLWMCLRCGLYCCGVHRKSHYDNLRMSGVGTDDKINGGHRIFFAVKPRWGTDVNSPAVGAPLPTVTINLCQVESPEKRTVTMNNLKVSKVSFEKVGTYGIISCVECHEDPIKLPVRNSLPCLGVDLITLCENVARVLHCVERNISLAPDYDEGSFGAPRARGVLDSGIATDTRRQNSNYETYSYVETNKQANSRAASSSNSRCVRARAGTLVEACISGFENRRNTCYFNSVLQCILQCNTFIDFMIRQNFTGSHTLVHHMSEMIGFMKSGPCAGDRQGIVDGLARALMGSLSEIVPMFGDGDQQDSQELFITLINGIADELDKGKSEEEKKGSQRVPFEGTLCTTVTCRGCKNQVKRDEVFMALSIPVTNSVEDSLEKLFERSTLNGDSQYACEVCFNKLSPAEQTKKNNDIRAENEARKLRKKANAEAKSLNCLYQDADVETSIGRFNGSLALHLLRFKCDDRGVYKVPGAVSFPKRLNLSKYVLGSAASGCGDTKMPQTIVQTNVHTHRSVSRPSNSLVHVSGGDGCTSSVEESTDSRRSQLDLELVGIISHVGSLHGGHYVAHVRSHTKPSMWFYCDDEEIYTVDESSVFEREQGVYMLFYDQLYH